MLRRHLTTVGSRAVGTSLLLNHHSCSPSSSYRTLYCSTTMSAEPLNPEQTHAHCRPFVRDSFHRIFLAPGNNTLESRNFLKSLLCELEGSSGLVARRERNTISLGDAPVEWQEFCRRTGVPLNNMQFMKARDLAWHHKLWGGPNTLSDVNRHVARRSFLSDLVFDAESDSALSAEAVGLRKINAEYEAARRAGAAEKKQMPASYKHIHHVGNGVYEVKSDVKQDSTSTAQTQRAGTNVRNLRGSAFGNNNNNNNNNRKFGSTQINKNHQQPQKQQPRKKDGFIDFVFAATGISFFTLWLISIPLGIANSMAAIKYYCSHGSRSSGASITTSPSPAADEADCGRSTAEQQQLADKNSTVVPERVEISRRFFETLGRITALVLFMTAVFGSTVSVMQLVTFVCAFATRSSNELQRRLVALFSQLRAASQVPVVRHF